MNDGKIVDYAEGQHKGTYDAGTTYSYGDIVSIDYIISIFGIAMPTDFICGVDSITGIAPEFTRINDLIGAWKPICKSGGLAIGTDKANSSGLSIGDQNVVGAPASQALGVMNTIGDSSIRSADGVYKGEWSSGTYFTGQIVFYSDNKFYSCSPDDPASGTTEEPGAGAGDWRAMFEDSVVTPWASGVYVSGDHFYVDQTINEVVVRFIYKVTTGATISVQPDYKALTSEDYGLVSAYALNHISVFKNAVSYYDIKYIPTLPILYSTEGETMPTIRSSESCLLSLAMPPADYPGERWTMLLVPLDADDPETSEVGVIYPNATMDVDLGFPMMILLPTDERKIVFEGGCLAAGFGNNVKGFAAAVLGMSSEAEKDCSVSLGNSSETEWVGELAHSSGMALDLNPLDDQRDDTVYARESMQTLVAITDLDGGYLSIPDPIGVILADFTDGMMPYTVEVPRLSPNTTYSFKISVIGSLILKDGDTQGYSAMYEGEVVIVAGAAWEYPSILKVENWTEVYADTLPSGSWSAPSVSTTELASNRTLQIDLPGLAMYPDDDRHVAWTASLKVHKHRVR
jgi:hypothetical protein